MIFTKVNIELDHNCKKNLKNNRKLAKQIRDVAWGQFLTLLEYKGDIYGYEIKRVDRFFPSSKRCSDCEYIKENLTRKDRESTCPECHVHHDRDIIAVFISIDQRSQSKFPPHFPPLPHSPDSLNRNIDTSN